MNHSSTAAGTRPRQGIDIVRFEHGGVRSLFATVIPAADRELESALVRLRDRLEAERAELVELKAFGAVAAYPAFRDVATRVLGPADWPSTYVEGHRCGGPGIVGIQAWAVFAGGVETIRLGERPVGRVFEGRDARYCVLGDVVTSNPALPRRDQVRETLEGFEAALDRAGMGLQNVVRTWFFIDRILDWYGEFNAVRGEVYGARGVFDRYVPASTGIGGRNAHGAAVLGSALALEPKGGDAIVREVRSPLQCSARAYGSAFSRAAEVSAGSWRWVLVSGTASIDPNGRTVHEGDVDAQIDRTLDVVGAILESRGLDFGDVVRGNAYFRRAQDAGALSARAARRGLPASRILVTENTVCRDDLWFELEVDALAGPGDGESDT